MARINVGPHEVAVQYINGSFATVLLPGRHRRPAFLPFKRVLVQRVDLRERLLSVPMQELLTSDGLGLRVSVIGRWKVADPKRFVEVSADPTAVLYAAVQLAVRDAVTDKIAEDVLRNRAGITDGLATAVSDVADGVGIEVISLALRDLALPAEVGRAFAEVALTRQQGAAALERARSEAAALRTLANAAKLLDDHPALALIRAIEKVPHGSKVVLER
jgi:regulator of protease activity HflC (stomatin/prohibitin superfamily)